MALKGENYGSYVLLNLYPQVTSTKESFNEDDGVNKDFVELLPMIINNYKENDFVIFWGRTVSISVGIKIQLDNLLGNGKLHMTVKAGTGKHYHPARVDIEIKDVKEDDIVDRATLLGK